MELPKGRFLVIIYAFSFLIQLTTPSGVYAFAEVNGKEDSTSLGYQLIHEGRFHAHARSFFMATDNEKSMTDYYAWAFGAGLSYESFNFHGFQVGLTGFFIFNLSSSDLGQQDALSKSGNRYEIGLFDISNPDNTSDLDRLEDLYLRYNYRKSKMEVGRFELNTPFLNRQDGRMRGTIEEGVWLEINEIRNLKIEGGWLWSISPRSTISWYRVEDSYGVYPSGVNESGFKSTYQGNINSTGIALAGITWQHKKVKMQLWNQLAENVFNTAILRSDFEFPITSQWKFKTGLMYVRQDALHNGGNPDQQKSYIRKGSFSDVYSFRAGLRKRSFEGTMNYTLIPGSNRFLMPREWGREPFYTFIPRERNEGFANLQAVVINLSNEFFKGKLKTALAYGHFFLPDVKDYKGNKYGLPSYRQLNTEVRYTFNGYLKGMSLLFLMAYKGALGETYDEYKYVFNKVNVSNWNLVVDYSF